MDLGRHGQLTLGDVGLLADAPTLAGSGESSSSGDCEKFPCSHSRTINATPMRRKGG